MYQEITLKQFKDCLWKVEPESRMIPQQSYTMEYVFELPFKADNKLAIRIFSSIHVSNNKSRDCGKDAIRILLWHKSLKKTVGGNGRVNRTANWRQNVEKKIASLKEKYPSIKCDKCDSGYLILKKGKFSKFYGCTNFAKGCSNIVKKLQ